MSNDGGERRCLSSKPLETTKPGERMMKRDRGETGRHTHTHTHTHTNWHTATGTHKYKERRGGEERWRETGSHDTAASDTFSKTPHSGQPHHAAVCPCAAPHRTCASAFLSRWASSAKTKSGPGLSSSFRTSSEAWAIALKRWRREACNAEGERDRERCGKGE